MKRIILLIIGLGYVFLGKAQSPAELQYAAYITASKTMWEKSVQVAKKESGEKSFEVAFAKYGLLNNTMATQDEETFDDHVDGTVDLLKEIIEKKPNWGEPKAVLSSVYGLAMAYSPMKGMLYGSKSSSLIDDAMRLQPESPLVQKLYAGSKLYTPEMFGGDPKKAVTSFEKSIEIYEKSGSVVENWMYLDTMVGASMAYRKTEQNQKAVAILEKAIEIEPQYHWAKSILAKIKE
jgi:tetratricopeptide (TPR) repeat protein